MHPRPSTSIYEGFRDEFTFLELFKKFSSDDVQVISLKCHEAKYKIVQAYRVQTISESWAASNDRDGP